MKILADGNTLVSRNWEDTFSFWDITTGEPLDAFSPKASKIRIKGDLWSRTVDGVVNSNGTVIYAIGNHDGTISIQDGRTHQLIRTLVPKTNEAAFLKVGDKDRKQKVVEVIRIPPEPEVKEKTIPSNFRDDGKPFPIQYRMDPQQSFHARLDKQPIKWIEKLKFSPDGKLLVSKSSYKIPRRGGYSGTRGPTELWDIEIGEQLAALPWWVDVAFSSDGKTVALLSYSGFSHGKCDVWDIVNRRQIAEFESTTKAKFSGDGSKLFITKGGSYDSDGIVEKTSYLIWDIATQSEIASMVPIDERIVVYPNNLLFSQDGSMLVTADEIGTVDVWETEAKMQSRPLTKGFTRAFTALAFSDDGKTLAGGSSGNIHLWRTERGIKQNTISTGKMDIEGITIAKDNKGLTTVGPGATSQWDFITGEQLTSNKTQFNLDVSSSSSSFGDGTIIFFPMYAYSPNFSTLAAMNRKENSVEIWSTATRKRIGLLIDDAYQSARGAMALTPDGSILATNDLFKGRYEVFLWETNTNERIATFNMSKNFIDKVISRFSVRSIHALAFDHDGKQLAVGIRNRNKEIQLWNVATQKRVKILKTPHEYAICTLAFSPDGSILASGDTGGEINVWATATGKHITTYNGHKGNISVLVFAQNNEFLASTGKFDGTIMLWNVP